MMDIVKNQGLKLYFNIEQLLSHIYLNLESNMNWIFVYHRSDNINLYLVLWINSLNVDMTSFAWIGSGVKAQALDSSSPPWKAFSFSCFRPSSHRWTWCQEISPCTLSTCFKSKTEREILRQSMKRNIRDESSILWGSSLTEAMCGPTLHFEEMFEGQYLN